MGVSPSNAMLKQAQKQLKMNNNIVPASRYNNRIFLNNF